MLIRQTTTFKRLFSQQPKVRPFKLGALNHIAIATPSFKQALPFYKNLTSAISTPHALPEHGVTTIFVDLGNTKIELLEPLGDNSPIANFLKKNPQGGIHHICINVDDINKAQQDMKAKGVRTLDEIKIGAHGKPVLFLHPKDCGGVLVELEQE